VRPARVAIAIIVCMLGAIWLGQGLALLPGSFMRGSPFWGLVGAVLVVGGVLLLLVERRRAR
jgi:hypothetical protein